MGKSKPESQPVEPRLADAASVGGYLRGSMEPLHVLVFLLPLVALYEYGSVRYLSDPDTGGMKTIAAHRAISAFFEAFGVVGIHLPAFTLVTVLLTWHVLSRKPWRVHLGVLLGMALESLLWTAPLIVWAIVMQGGAAIAGLAGGAGDLNELPYLGRLTVALGAGLYEELLFRMIAIAALHMVFVDLARMKPAVGSVMAVVLSALGFALYHDLSPGGVEIRWNLFGFYFVSGLFFGFLYLGRGFGIPVAVHALYDVFALSSGS